VRYGRTALVGATLVLLGGCSSSPVLLSEDDVPDVVLAEQNNDLSIAPGWTFCDEISPNVYLRAPVVGTWFQLEGGATVGASVLDRRADGLSADLVLEQIAAAADQCALESETYPGTGRTIEPLDDLDDGSLGWRTRAGDGTWGEYVVQPLDASRVLAVGFTTTQDDPPVDLSELIEQAEAGSEQLRTGRD
jgi:hypothetical protein